jgi:hypothetical protein
VALRGSQYDGDPGRLNTELYKLLNDWYDFVYLRRYRAKVRPVNFPGRRKAFRPAAWAALRTLLPTLPPQPPAPPRRRRRPDLVPTRRR